MDRTEKRFANYAKAGLLCGADGLPHLISDPGLALKYGHAGEVFVSTRCTLGGGVAVSAGLRVVGSSSRAPARQQAQGRGAATAAIAVTGVAPVQGLRPCQDMEALIAMLTPCLVVVIALQIPTFGFLYVAGWIGYVGRLYLNAVRRQVAAGALGQQHALPWPC